MHESGYWSNLEKSQGSEDAITMNTAHTNKSKGQGKKHEEDVPTEKFHFEIEDIDLDKRIPSHMISPHSFSKLFWNLLIMMLTIYTAILLPIRLAFLEETGTSGALFFIDMFTDIVFVIDIFLNFFFVEEDVNGEMIVNQKELAKKYIKSWLMIDIVASIPVSIIIFFIDTSTGDGLFTIRFLKLTKFTRLYRLLALFKMMKLFKNHKFLEQAITYFSCTTDIK